MTNVDIWTYREQGWTTSELTGLDVEALDGGIGKIDEASYDVGAGYIVVDTGPWIFGKKVGASRRRGGSRRPRRREGIRRHRTTYQIKNAPEFDEEHLPRPR